MTAIPSNDAKWSWRRVTRIVLILVIVLAAGAGGAWYWWQSQQGKLPEGIVSGNGRIESDQIDIAAKLAGRVREVLAREGDLVTEGQVLARLDTTELQAQRAKYAADVASEEASMLEAKATVVQRQAELTLKEAKLRRALKLIVTGAISEDNRDEAQGERDSARAVLDAAQRTVTARERSVVAAQALVNQTDAQIADTILVAPVQGRVLYRLVNPGEVVSAGGKVLTIIDLSEIYMEIYLPSEQAMRVTIGSAARIVFDGAGQSEFRVAGRAVHAQAGRDAQRTRQAYVPGQAAHPAEPHRAPPQPSENGHPRHRLCAPRSEPAQLAGHPAKAHSG